MQTLTDKVGTVPENALLTRIYRATRTLSRQTQWHLFTITLIFFDALMMLVAAEFAYLIRFQLSLDLFHLDVVPIPAYYFRLSLVVIPLWLVVFALNGLYQRRNLLGGIQEYSRIFAATSMSSLLVVVLGFLQTDFPLARGWLVLTWLLTAGLVTITRFCLRRVIYLLRRFGFFLMPTLVVGTNAEGRSLVQHLKSWHTSGYHVIGFIAEDEHSLKPTSDSVPLLATLAQLRNLIEKYAVEELIIATSAISRDNIVHLFTQYGLSNDVNVSLSTGLFEIITTGLEIKDTTSVPLVAINKMRLTTSERVLKFLLDYAITLPLLLLALPIMVIVAILVKLDSPGPVIYRRRVMGINGRQFDAYKFRTMHINGDDLLAAYPELEDELASTHKLKTDPRVTRLGHTLRRLSLDELPQLFNVLKRDMSLVGPRMISPPEMAMYKQWQTNLLTVHPGITGFWQVNGRSDVSYEDRVNLDMRYIRTWTIWLDFQILFQTIPTVLKGRGAY